MLLRAREAVGIQATSAATYNLNLLANVGHPASTNLLVARYELEIAIDHMKRTRPVLEKMKSEWNVSLESVEDTGFIAANTRNVLEHTLECQTSVVGLPTSLGLLGVWDYAREVRWVLLSSFDYTVKPAEDNAQVIASDEVKKIGEVYHPLGVERNRWMFMAAAKLSTTGRSEPLERCRARNCLAGL
jgi:mitofusin 2